MEYKHLKLWLLSCYFGDVIRCSCHHKCTSHIIFGEAVYPNTLVLAMGVQSLIDLRQMVPRQSDIDTPT